MRILHVLNSLGTGGAEKLLLDTIPKYNALGYTVDLLLLWNDNHQFTESLIKQNVCNVYILNNSSNVKDIYKLENINKMRSYIKGYDIIHVHLFPCQYFVVLAKMLNGAASAKTKLIYTEHNTTNNRIGKPYFKLIDKFFYKRYDKLVCITEEIRDIYKSYLNYDDSYYHVIFNGVDLKRINNANAYPKSQIHPSLKVTDCVLMQIAAFRPQKDQEALIKSLQYLPEHVKVVLVGDGELRPHNEALAKTLNLTSRVFFLGQRMDVPELLKSADIVVLSSHYEGLSLASIEGLGSGKPFVAANVPGLKEIVGGAGILFEESNDKDLAEKISALINDPNYAQEVAASSKKRASTYDIDNMVNAHIKLYNELYKN